MKKIISLLTLSLIILSTTYAQDETTVDAYFTSSEMPDMMKFMPGPPDSFCHRRSPLFLGQGDAQGLCAYRPDQARCRLWPGYHPEGI